MCASYSIPAMLSTLPALTEGYSAVAFITFSLLKLFSLGGTDHYSTCCFGFCLSSSMKPHWTSTSQFRDYKYNSDHSLCGLLREKS